MKIRLPQKHYFALLFAIVCTCIYTNCKAQRYPFYNLGVENGLIQSQATSLAQDTVGHLWVGTLGGLSRFDGKTFTNYTIHNGMPSNVVRAVATDKKGNVWVGYQGGVSRFDGKTFKNYFTTSIGENPNTTIDGIYATDSNIWCKGGGKLYKINNNKLSRIQIPCKYGYVSFILPDDSMLWVAKAGGVLYNYHSNKWDSLLFTHTTNNTIPFVISMFKDKHKNIWLGTNIGLYKIESGKIVPAVFNHTTLINISPVFAITEDSIGDLWMSLNSGALCINKGIPQYYNKKNGLSDNMFYDCLTDKEGNVWFSSDGQGIFRYSGTQFTALDEKIGLPSAQVMALAAERTGRLFIGTYDDGLYTFENGKINPLPLGPNKHAPITSLAISQNGKLWIGTKGLGIWSLKNKTLTQAFQAHHLSTTTVSNIYADPENRLWISLNGGALLYENDTLKNLHLGMNITTFISIGKDSILIAAHHEIELYHNGNASSFKTNTILDSSEIECLLLKGKELWAGTTDNGVVVYNIETHKHYIVNKKNGLQSDFIYNIIADNDGNVWVGTGFGIYKIKVQDPGQPVASFYGKSQGITGMESNQNAVFKMHDGSIWFGTTNGASHYQPHSQMVVPHPISVVMQAVKLFGENITDTTYFDAVDKWYNVPCHLHLPYKKNNISFTFQGITLSGDDQIKYSYHLDGVDAPWSNWSSINSVTYSALPPGKYTFRVKCKVGAIDNEDRELVYEFEITTPFQKTGWFSLIILIACILLGISIQYIANTRRQNRIRLTQKLRDEEQAKIRVRTAEDFHDEVGNKLTRINVLTNVLKNKIDNPTPDINRILDQIQDNTGQLYSGTRDILWSLKPSNDNLYEILHRIRDFGTELFQDTEIDFIFSGDETFWQDYRLPLDVSRNLIMIFKEALNNTLKYSKATRINLEISLKPKPKHILHLVLKDNGVGFDQHNLKKGHGIDNMNIRAERIKGVLHIDSTPGKGTIISLTFKIKNIGNEEDIS